MICKINQINKIKIKIILIRLIYCKVKKMNFKNKKIIYKEIIKN